MFNVEVCMLLRRMSVSCLFWDGFWFRCVCGLGVLRCLFACVWVYLWCRGIVVCLWGGVVFLGALLVVWFWVPLRVLFVRWFDFEPVCSPSDPL